MLRLSTFCLLLALAVAQNGYDYNKPNRPFGSGSSSSRPGTSPGTSISTTTSYPNRAQNDDFSGPDGPTTGYPTGPQNYPGSSSQRPGYQGSNYPGQGNDGPSGNYPGQSDSYPGSRGPNGYSDQGSRYPGSGTRYPGQNYPGQSGNGFGPVGFADNTGNYEGGDYSAIPGEPDIDYPVLSYIPQTSFDCRSQSYPGYYSDVETRCQVFHVCANNKTYDFLCPNGTVFSQEDFVCVWWNEFTCESAPSLYELNANLYDYSIRGSSDNFQDYQGSSTFGNRGPQGPSSYPGTLRTSSYPGSGSQGPSTPYPGGSGSYPSSPGTSGSYPESQSPSGSFPGSQSSSGSYPGSQSSSGSYPGSQSSSGSYPGSQSSSGSYPGSQSSSGSYPGSQAPSQNYPGYQGPSSNYPGYPGTYPNGSRNPQGPQDSQGPSGGSGSPGSGFPRTGSDSSLPDSRPGSESYPSGRPNGSSSQSGGNRRKPAQTPNREYLPPKN